MIPTSLRIFQRLLRCVVESDTSGLSRRKAYLPVLDVATCGAACCSKARRGRVWTPEGFWAIVIKPGMK